MLVKPHKQNHEWKYQYQEDIERRRKKEEMEHNSTLTAEKVYGFTASCLVHRFDGAVEIPNFHKELWKMCCSPYSKIAIAAPRNHAKSTSVTLSYLLSAVLFRDRKFVLIVSDTEGQATQFLNNLKVELEENEDIVKLFGISSFIKDAATDLIVQMDDGYQFRIMAKGSEQKVRGTIWRNKRPDLIIGDDLENDEIVMNKDRRKKFRNWLFKALIPALSDDGIIRIVGTILHLDSALERLLGDETWISKRYRAHNPDFSFILWPERFPRERLEEIRHGYVEQGMPDGYSQEYLNYPIDEENAYFKREDLLPYTQEEIKKKNLMHYTAVDFAIGEKERADYTVIATIGISSESKMYVLDIKRGRWDAKEIIDSLFNVYTRYKPEMVIMEGGAIEKSISPFIRDEMYRRNTFLPLEVVIPNKDKQSRARPLQARMRQGAVFFDHEASWYASLEEEMTQFPRSKHDDIVDALAWIGLTIDRQGTGLTEEEIEEEEWEYEFGGDYTGMVGGICQSTGY